MEVKRLPSGYYHIRGNGPCEWAQVPNWPCSESAIRVGAFPEASEQFIREVITLANKETDLAVSD